jgi:uncharacterized protein (DUF983 family)
MLWRAPALDPSYFADRRRGMSFWSNFFNSCRLRCPRCGGSRQFRGWFTMWPKCSRCGLPFEREPGFYLGSIYFNYGLTALIVTIAYFIFFFATDVPQNVVLGLLTAFCVLFPLWFFRYARSLWLGMDEYIDPDSEKRKPGSTTPGSATVANKGPSEVRD